MAMTSGDTIPASGFALRPRRAGELMDVSFRLTKQTIRTMWPLLLAVLVPLSLVSATQLTSISDSLGENDFGTRTNTSNAQTGVSFLFLIGIGVLLLAMVPAMYSIHMGKDMSLGESVRAGLRRAPIAILYAIMAFVAFIVLMIPFFIVVFIAFFVLIKIGSAAGVVGVIIVVVVAYLAMIVALLGIAARFQLGFVALVLEDIGPMEALRRGWRLSAGRWLQLGAIQSAMLVLSYIVILIAVVIATLLKRSVEGKIGVTIVAFLGYLLFTMWWNTMYTALGVSMYVDSRVRTEALDLGQLSSQLSTNSSALLG
jgi:hypothetical protein